MTERIIDYYDLIELPDGSHIPVPQAIKMVGLKKVLEIPIAEKKRDDYFYYCEECGQHSFFKCRLHTNYYDPIRAKVKEIVFKRLVNSDLIKLLKYIEVEDSYHWISKGYMIVHVYKPPLGGYWIEESHGAMIPIVEMEKARYCVERIKWIEKEVNRLHKDAEAYCEKIAEHLKRFLPSYLLVEFPDLERVKIEVDKDGIDSQVKIVCYPHVRLDPRVWRTLLFKIDEYLVELLPFDVFMKTVVVLMNKDVEVDQL